MKGADEVVYATLYLYNVLKEYLQKFFFFCLLLMFRSTNIRNIAAYG